MNKQKLIKEKMKQNKVEEDQRLLKDGLNRLYSRMARLEK